jgi:hypothetical protein
MSVLRAGTREGEANATLARREPEQQATFPHIPKDFDSAQVGQVRQLTQRRNFDEASIQR